MADFFNGWRRKVGLLILVSACALMCGWVRSYARLDVMQFNCKQNGDQFWSFRGSLGLRQWIGLTFDPDLQFCATADASEAEGLVTLRDDPFVDIAPLWRKGSTGFHVGEGTHLRGSGSPMFIMAIPYWFPILILSLVSGCLILSKSRPKASIPVVIFKVSIAGDDKSNL